MRNLLDLLHYATNVERLFFCHLLLFRKPVPANKDSPSCAPCEKGEWSEQNGSCQKCLPGEFSPEPGYAWCIPCPVGKFQAQSGMDQCDPAEPGYFVPEQWSSKQTRCPEDKWSSAGSSTCNNCPCKKGQERIRDFVVYLSRSLSLATSLPFFLLRSWYRSIEWADEVQRHRRMFGRSWLSWTFPMCQQSEN